MSQLPVREHIAATADTVRQLAQSDPTRNLTVNLGLVTCNAKERLAHLVSSLRELDDIVASLHQQGVDVTVDLGPIGNAAASVRRDLEKQGGPKFELPRAS